MTGRRGSVRGRSIGARLRFPIYAVLLATGLFLFHAAWYEYQWFQIVGFLLAAAGLLLLNLAAVGIWRSLAVPLIASSRGIVRYLTAVPFWFLGGAIGYTIGMLTAKKLGLLEFWDQPIAPIVLDGGLLSCCVNIVHEVLMRRGPARENPSSTSNV